MGIKATRFADEETKSNHSAHSLVYYKEDIPPMPKYSRENTPKPKEKASETKVEVKNKNEKIGTDDESTRSKADNASNASLSESTKAQTKHSPMIDKQAQVDTK